MYRPVMRSSWTVPGGHHSECPTVATTDAESAARDGLGALAATITKAANTVGKPMQVEYPNLSFRPMGTVHPPVY